MLFDRIWTRQSPTCFPHWRFFQYMACKTRRRGPKTYNNLGLVYSLRSDFAKSAEMFESAGLVRKQTNTLQMPMNARRLYNFASMRLKQSRGTSGSDAEHWILEAQTLFQEALDILADYEPWQNKETFSDFFCSWWIPGPQVSLLFWCLTFLALTCCFDLRWFCENDFVAIV